MSFLNCERMLTAMSRRYCVVLQTIAKKPELSVSVRGTEEVEPGVERTLAWGQSK